MHTYVHTYAYTHHQYTRQEKSGANDSDMNWARDVSRDALSSVCNTPHVAEWSVWLGLVARILPQTIET